MKAFWEINHLLPKTEWIRLMGSMHKLKWEIFQTDEDWSNPIKRKEWEEWDGMPYEKRWAKLIAEYSIERNQKGIVFAGLHHSTTEFHQPIVINGKFQRFEDDRMGNFLYKKYGKRVKLIALHYPWFDRSGYNGSYVIPFHGKLDSLAEKSGYPFGIFSEQQSILDSGSVYSQGFNPLDISNLCDGYIVVAPICKQKVVTVIPNFVHSGNLNESKRQEYTMRDSKFTVKSFNDSIQSWVNDIEGRLKKICELKH
jgi:hypothetical protein